MDLRTNPINRVDILTPIGKNNRGNNLIKKYRSLLILKLKYTMKYYENNQIQWND